MPTSVKAISVLTVLLVFICWGFFGVFQTTQPDNPMTVGILGTAVSYTVLAPVVVWGAMKRKVMAVRVGLGLIFLASLYVPGPIGIVIGLIGIGLTFRAAAKEWFAG